MNAPFDALASELTVMPPTGSCSDHPYSWFVRRAEDVSGWSRGHQHSPGGGPDRRADRALAEPFGHLLDRCTAGAAACRDNTLHSATGVASDEHVMGHRNHSVLRFGGPGDNSPAPNRPQPSTLANRDTQKLCKPGHR